MSYEYTDEDGVRLHVDDYATNSNIYVHEEGSPTVGILLPHEDAPALALAILEAAGITPSIGSHPDTTPEEFESAAAFYLREAINKRSKQAEREAEDAKVVAFHGAIGANLNRIERHHRDLYRAAREFFAKEDHDAR